MPHLCFEVSWEVFDFPTWHCFLRGFALRTGQGQVCPSCRASPRGSRRGTPREPTGQETWGICVYIFCIFVFRHFFVFHMSQLAGLPGVDLDRYQGRMVPNANVCLVHLALKEAFKRTKDWFNHKICWSVPYLPRQIWAISVNFHFSQKLLSFNKILLSWKKNLARKHLTAN